MERTLRLSNVDGYQHLIKAKQYFSNRVKSAFISTDIGLVLSSEGISDDAKVFWSEGFDWLARQMTIATKL
jgi:hypothetical protein